MRYDRAARIRRGLTVRLIGPDYDASVDNVSTLLDNQEVYDQTIHVVNLIWWRTCLCIVKVRP